MRASFVIGFHTARRANLIQTLTFLRNWHPDLIQNCELVTVCQDSISFELPVETWGRHAHFDLKLSEMSLPTVTNFGIDKTTSDKIIVLESDRILHPGYFEAVVSQLHDGIQITTSKMQKLTRECSDDEILGCTCPFNWEYRSPENEMCVRNMWSGNTAFMKSDYYKSGRMDESYIGYGWADSDMTLTMESHGVKSIYRDEIEIHLWHEPMTYGTADQKKLFIDNGIRFCRKWDKPYPQLLREEMVNYRGNTLI